VKITRFGLASLGLALVLPAAAQSSGKIGVINIQSAIAGTKDGQKAASDLQVRFNPKKTEFEKRQSDIAQLQEQLNRGANTLSEEARTQLTREIDQKTKSLNRDTEDARSELDQEEQKVMNELGGRIMAVIDKYAKDKSYTLVLDISSPQTPVLFASSAIDITKEIIELYDKNAAAGAPAAKPAAVPGPKATPPK